MLLEAEMDPGLCYARLQKDMRSDSYSGTLRPRNLSVRQSAQTLPPDLITPSDSHPWAINKFNFCSATKGEITWKAESKFHVPYLVCMYVQVNRMGMGFTFLFKFVFLHA